MIFIPLQGTSNITPFSIGLSSGGGRVDYK
jgi:hypothetical protein